mgnify:CR=1 FL=1
MVSRHPKRVSFPFPAGAATLRATLRAVPSVFRAVHEPPLRCFGTRPPAGPPVRLARFPLFPTPRRLSTARGPQAQCANRQSVKNRHQTKSVWGSPGGTRSWRGAARAIRRPSIQRRRRHSGTGGWMLTTVGGPGPIFARRRWDVANARSPGCGIPKVPHRTFGAEGVHRGSGVSGPCERLSNRRFAARTESVKKPRRSLNHFHEAQ